MLLRTFLTVVGKYNMEKKSIINAMSNWIFWLVTIILLIVISLNVKENQKHVKQNEMLINKLLEDTNEIKKKQSPPLLKKRIQEINANK